MTKVLTAGTNTMMIPDSTPGMDSGKMTLVKTWCSLEPISFAASISDGSVFVSDRVDRQNHEGQVIIYHAQHHRSRGIDDDDLRTGESQLRKLFSRPLFSRIVSQAYVRSRKFIHMGSMIRIMAMV